MGYCSTPNTFILYHTWGYGDPYPFAQPREVLMDIYA